MRHERIEFGNQIIFGGLVGDRSDRNAHLGSPARVAIVHRSQPAGDLDDPLPQRIVLIWARDGERVEQTWRSSGSRHTGGHTSRAECLTEHAEQVGLVCRVTVACEAGMAPCDESDCRLESAHR